MLSYDIVAEPFEFLLNKKTSEYRSQPSPDIL